MNAVVAAGVAIFCLAAVATTVGLYYLLMRDEGTRATPRPRRERLHAAARWVGALATNAISPLRDWTGNALAWVLDGGRDRSSLPREATPAAQDNPPPPASWTRHATRHRIQRLPGRPWEMETGEFPAVIAAMDKDHQP